MNLIFSSKSLHIPGCLEKVWDSQDFHMTFAVVFFNFFFFKRGALLTKPSSHSHFITDITFTCLILKSYLPWTIRKMLTNLGICLWYISFLGIFVIDFYTAMHTYLEVSTCFESIKIQMWTNPLLSYSKRSQTLSEKKNLSQEGCSTSIRCSGLLLKSWYVR